MQSRLSADRDPAIEPGNSRDLELEFRAGSASNRRLDGNALPVVLTNAGSRRAARAAWRRRTTAPRGAVADLPRNTGAAPADTPRLEAPAMVAALAPPSPNRVGCSFAQFEASAQSVVNIQSDLFGTEYGERLPRWRHVCLRWQRRVRRKPIWEAIAPIALLATIVAAYSGLSPRWHVVETSSDPPRWVIEPAVAASKPATSAAIAATPRPVPAAPVDPLVAAKASLGGAEQMLAAGQLDAALAGYRAGLTQLPPGQTADALRIAVYNRMGLALGSAGRLAEAIATFRAATRQFPGDSNLQNNLGVTLENAGGAENGRAALAAFQAALRLDPTSQSARDNVAAALKRLGRTAEANGLLAAAGRTFGQ